MLNKEIALLLHLSVELVLPSRLVGGFGKLISVINYKPVMFKDVYLYTVVLPIRHFFCA